MANRSTCATCSTEGRLITHWRVRIRLSDVLPSVPRPSMQLQPSHHTDDIGARLGEPSSLRVLMIATGVPKYRTVGSMVLCMRRTYTLHRRKRTPVLATKSACPPFGADLLE